MPLRNHSRSGIFGYASPSRAGCTGLQAGECSETEFVRLRPPKNQPLADFFGHFSSTTRTEIVGLTGFATRICWIRRRVRLARVAAVAKSCVRPFVAMQRAVLNANCCPSSVAVVFPAPVPATAPPIAIAVDDRWHPIHDWRWIGLIDIGTRRPIGTRWCIAGLVDYRRWWRRNRRVIATHIGLGQS
jgi:hypothetical protein